MASVYGGGAHGASQTELQHPDPKGRVSPKPFPRTWESSNYDALDLSLEPPESPERINLQAYRRNDSIIQPERIKSFVTGMARPKARPRGESDLGRPATKLNTTIHGRANGFAFPTVPENGSVTPVTAKASFQALPETLRALLLPTPYLLASIAFDASHFAGRLLSEVASPFDAATKQDTRSPSPETATHLSMLLHACGLASMSLILLGAWGSIRTRHAVLDRRKTGLTPMKSSKKLGTQAWSMADLRHAGRAAAGLILSFYAAAQLGGPRAALLFVLIAVEVGNMVAGKDSRNRAEGTTPFTLGLIVLCVFLDLIGLTSDRSFLSTLYGVLAISAIFVLSLIPGPASDAGSQITSATSSTSAVPATPSDTPTSPGRIVWPRRQSSALLATTQGAQTTLICGLSLALITSMAMWLSVASSCISWVSTGSSLFAAVAAAGLLLYGKTPLSRDSRVFSMTFGGGLIMITSFLQPVLLSTNTPFWVTWLSSVLPLLGCIAVIIDTGEEKAKRKQSPPRQASNEHGHQHNHAKHSALTARILEFLPSGSLLHSIMIEKDSRRIAYFACLNLGFMLIQFFYGFVSGSLGLLTDSIHMLFDCAGLAVGLAAAVMSKWPPSLNFPYGYGKIDTLSGFANGIFLILVSVEIVFDAVHRLGEGHELRRLNELLVVSILGFLVNIVGLTAFGHAHHHHGHDHEHTHSHDHSHAHDDHHDHSAALSPPLANDSIPPTPLSANTPAASPNPSHHKHHHHDNENMQGIFLHILADALGSLAVILSTLLTQYTGWHGWDPIASCIISILIFFSAVPLVKGAGMRLLLSLPDEVEYSVRNALSELGELRGVVGYQVPKFWMAEGGGKEQKHHHAHEHHEHEHHGHSHHGHDQHGHEHGCDGAHEAHAHDETPKQTVMGVVHVTAARPADMEDLRERVTQFLKTRGIDAIVQVEREGDQRCWCSAGMKVG